MQTHVTLGRDAGVGSLTFACDEPGKPPTLDLQVLDELEACIHEITVAADRLHAIVVQSDSKKYFVVGANIRALEALDAETIVPWIQRGHTVLDQLAALPLPVVARVDGYALGGGLELAMACDLIVASCDARFGQPEANLGFVAGWGGTFRLPRRVGMARAKELFFTGKIIEAQPAYELGLVDFVGDDKAVSDYVSSLLQGILKLSPVAISQMKRLVNCSFDITPQQSCIEETAASSVCLTMGDTRARVRAFLDRNK
jgi:enoyl-CoA hydratase